MSFRSHFSYDDVAWRMMKANRHKKIRQKAKKQQRHLEQATWAKPRGNDLNARAHAITCWQQEISQLTMIIDNLINYNHLTVLNARCPPCRIRNYAG